MFLTYLNSSLNKLMTSNNEAFLQPKNNQVSFPHGPHIFWVITLKSVHSILPSTQFYSDIYQYVHRGWCPKFATWLNIISRHSSKSIWVTNLIFCQNDSQIRRSSRQKDSLITHILFELYLLWYLAYCQIHRITL